MASLLPNGKQQFSSAAGPMVGGKVYTYDAGTLVPRATYTDAAGLVPNTNPIILDARGEATVFWSGSYKVVLKDALDNTIWTIDNVSDIASTLAGSGGSSLISFLQGGANAVAMNLQTLLRGLPIFPEEFGAVGDGATDDTTYVQRALTYAASIGGSVQGMPGRVYSVSTVNAPLGIKEVNFLQGTLKGRGAAVTGTSGVLTLGSLANPLTHAKVSACIDVSAGDLQAIYGEQPTDCQIVENVIYGFINHATLNHYAIRLNGPSLRNIVSRNNITLFNTPTQRGFGVAFYGTAQPGELWGGFYTGAPVHGLAPAIGNIISDNSIINGSYAISIQTCEYCVVQSNYCHNQNHRNVYCAGGAWYNNIVANEFRDFLSTAVLLGYGAVANLVANNTCFGGSVAVGQAALLVNTGSPYNKLIGNKVIAATYYGIYISTDSHSTTASENDISSHYVSAINLDNTFVPARPANDIFSLPSYDPPAAPYTEWSYLDLKDCVIQNNVIRDGYTGRNTGAITVNQLDGIATKTAITGLVVSGNKVIGPSNIFKNFYVFCQTAGKLTNMKTTDNMFNEAVASPSVEAYNAAGTITWANMVGLFANNAILDSKILAEPIVLDDNATPSVSSNSPRKWRQYEFNPAAPINITGFSNMDNGDVIRVRLHPSITLIYDVNVMRLKGAVNCAGGSTNNWMTFTKSNNVIFELTRNF